MICGIDSPCKEKPLQLPKFIKQQQSFVLLNFRVWEPGRLSSVCHGRNVFFDNCNNLFLIVTGLKQKYVVCSINEDTQCVLLCQYKKYLDPKRSKQLEFKIFRWITQSCPEDKETSKQLLSDQDHRKNTVDEPVDLLMRIKCVHHQHQHQSHLLRSRRHLRR